MASQTNAVASRTPPGPRDFFGLRTLRAIKRDPLGTLQALQRAYGDVVYSPLVNAPTYLLAHPDHVGHVLQANHRNYRRSRNNDKLRRALGNGLLTNDGASWLKQRRLIQPAFHRKRIARFGEAMTNETHKLLGQWQDEALHEKPLDISSEMMRLTLAIVSRTMFGATIGQEGEELGPAVTALQEETHRRQFVLLDLPEWVPLPHLRRAGEARKTIERVVTRIIEERRRADDPAHNDVLAMLLNAKDADTGASMADAQLRDEVRTIFLAGHETTSNALTWTWYLLARNPDAATKLRAELDHVLGGRLPTTDDIPQLPYTKMVVEESMRLLPPVWALSREAIADDEIDGYRIPAGSTVVLSQFITHRHPDFWEEPEAFDPERFSPDRANERHRFAYFPFGGGPRICIGSSFAMLEAQLILATIAQHYELELVPEHPVELEPLITLRPKHGMMMTLRPYPLAAARTGGHVSRSA